MLHPMIGQKPNVTHVTLDRPQPRFLQTLAPAETQVDTKYEQQKQYLNSWRKA